MVPSNVYDLALRRNWLKTAGMPFPDGRFVVFQVHPAGRYQEEFWSLDSFENAKRLCQDLAKDGRGAYVFDKSIQLKIFDLKARGE